MKTFVAILFASTSLSSVLAVDVPGSNEGTNAVVISTGYIAGLVAEARTNNPSLRAADSRVNASTLNVEAVRTWDDPMFMLGGSTFSPRGMDPAQQGDL